MDAYLKIAECVLEDERRPLSPKATLDIAYDKKLVPVHLHGKTQHKTLQARICEDIVERREHSPFFRTQPGRFFLRKFFADEDLPEEFRVEFPARRRIRELVRGPALAMEYTTLKEVAPENTPISTTKILDLLHADKFCYDDPRRKNDNLVFFAVLRLRLPGA
jgi:HB1, ASXL, restriction endonuclease HTH domain